MTKKSGFRLYRDFGGPVAPKRKKRPHGIMSTVVGPSGMTLESAHANRFKYMHAHARRRAMAEEFNVAAPAPRRKGKSRFAAVAGAAMKAIGIDTDKLAAST